MSPKALAPHVQAAIQRTPLPRPAAAQARMDNAPPPVRPVVQRKEAKAPLSPAHLPPSQSGEFVIYEDRKTPGVPPPPPRWPVYALHCPDKGPCVIEDVKTGRMREAGNLYGGFVRMSRTGPV